MGAKKKLNTALVVGLGSIGRRHCRLLKQLLPDIRIIALRHQPADDTFAVDLNLHAVVYSIEEALSYCPDFAIIANPASHHVEISLALLERDVHLLIEKPISSNIEDALKLVDVAKRSQSKIMIAYNLRFDPSLIALKRLIEAGRVGEVLSIRAEVGQNLADWRPGTDYKDGVSAKRSLGGGVLLELSHELDYLLWIFGELDWVVSHATKQSSLNIDVEDLALILLGFKSRSKPSGNLVASLNMDFFRQDHTRVCYVIGDKGTLKWNGVDHDVWFFSSATKCWERVCVFDFDRDFTYSEELNHFVNCVVEDEEPAISVTEGFNVLRTIDSITQANVDQALCHVN